MTVRLLWGNPAMGMDVVRVIHATIQLGYTSTLPTVASIIAVNLLGLYTRCPSTPRESTYEISVRPPPASRPFDYGPVHYGGQPLGPRADGTPVVAFVSRGSDCIDFGSIKFVEHGCVEFV
jgi:hypothetical protein